MNKKNTVNGYFCNNEKPSVVSKAAAITALKAAGFTISEALLGSQLFDEYQKAENSKLVDKIIVRTHYQ